MKTYEESKRDFLIRLTELSRETGLIILGGSYCTIGILSEEDAEELSAGYEFSNLGEVSWVSPGHKCVLENNMDGICSEIESMESKNEI